jgi:hypothetical protein
LPWGGNNPNLDKGKGKWLIGSVPENHFALTAFVQDVGARLAAGSYIF